MKLSIAPLPLLAAALLGSPAIHAQDASAGGSQFAYGKLGNLGLGAGVGTLLNRDAVLRLGANGGARYNGERKFSGIEYDIKDKPGTTLEVLADWYPLAGSGLRLTGGLLLGNARAALEGKRDAAGNYSINNRSYSAATVGELKGKVKFNTLAPYLGVGWESERPGKKGWHFFGDAGLVYLGKGDTSLSATGAAGNAALRRDIESEKRQLSSDLKHNLGMAVSLGVVYAF